MKGDAPKGLNFVSCVVQVCRIISCAYFLLNIRIISHFMFLSRDPYG